MDRQLAVKLFTYPEGQNSTTLNTALPTGANVRNFKEDFGPFEEHTRTVGVSFSNEVAMR